MHSSDGLPRARRKNHGNQLQISIAQQAGIGRHQCRARNCADRAVFCHCRLFRPGRSAKIGQAKASSQKGLNRSLLLRGRTVPKACDTQSHCQKGNQRKAAQPYDQGQGHPCDMPQIARQINGALCHEASG